ncbi:MAG: molybdopterin-guanine dinucleotide biosynthesis protein B [Candidatus Bathyarchaeota archaeon]|nr:molybdopterin-guanine dinucleotide biosynthesis protein B [Candidatus Bathyarchaeum tardum]WGM89831.1 MAG: molybdopterin-guanine dinucleotide biosynthesis protein B [Candidatus Bathyarchaeum tardum]WNZ30072.1 MAG: molybdopterin-guanine dinucleotide biosynthesis protein B [Candidatus Bathyarchaeota archaeon]
MTFIVAVIGSHGSGKTTTIEYLISCLTTQGYAVGTIKHIHHENFSIDTPGTNTWRHMQAGSKITVAVAPKEIVVLKKTESELRSLNKILGLLANENLDYIFVEGFHKLISERKDIPKIVTAKNFEDLTETLERTSHVFAVSGLIAQKSNTLEGVIFPVIQLPDDCDKLLRMLKDFFSKQSKS